jgi:hypothetical protein
MKAVTTIWPASWSLRQCRDSPSRGRVATIAPTARRSRALIASGMDARGKRNVCALVPGASEREARSKKGY